MFKKLQEDYASVEELQDAIRDVAKLFRPASLEMLKFVLQSRDLAEYLPIQLDLLEQYLNEENKERVAKTLVKMMKRGMDANAGFTRAKDQFFEVSNTLNDITSDAKRIEKRADGNQGTAKGVAIGVGVGAG